LIISITDPNSNWKEWIKPLGVLPFAFDIKEKQNGYDVYVDSNLHKKYPTEIKRFKQLFHKSA
jgi:phosphoadenosine phosphosulfate reductase